MGGELGLRSQLGEGTTVSLVLPLPCVDPQLLTAPLALVGVVPTLLIWPLYFAGQALIATGVVNALAADRRTASR